MDGESEENGGAQHSKPPDASGFGDNENISVCALLYLSLSLSLSLSLALSFTHDKITHTDRQTHTHACMYAHVRTHSRAHRHDVAFASQLKLTHSCYCIREHVSAMNEQLRKKTKRRPSETSRDTIVGNPNFAVDTAPVTKSSLDKRETNTDAADNAVSFGPFWVRLYPAMFASFLAAARNGFISS